MGNLKYFGLLIAAGMFAACSDNLENAGNENDGPKTGEGYVKVAINLPSVSSSRAFNESTDLNDGDKSEYEVKGGIIAFFEQAKTSASDANDETQAEFVKAYGLGSFTQNDDQTTNDHISTTITKILEAPLLSKTGNQMYALVILNPCGLIGIGANALSLYESSTDDSPINVTTLAELRNAKWNLGTNGVGDITSKTNGFLMLNASLYKADASPKTQTLVPVTVYPTEREAGENPAAKIFVERIVAKVDVVGPAGGTLDVQDAGGIYTGDKVTFTGEGLGWILNVTNKNTRPLRDLANIETWKLYNKGSGVIGTASSLLNDWSRIYWTEDHNYDNTSTDFIIYNTTTNPPLSWGGYSTSATEGIAPQYCLENTAPYQFNNENNTTSVWIKAIYNFNPDAAAQSFFIVDKVGEIKNATEIIDYIKGILTDKSGIDGLTLNEGDDVPGGFYDTVEEYNKLFKLSGENTFDQDDVNKIGEIRYYKDGGCYYYAAPIKHFGQNYTSGDDKTKNDYQGRYGVVRNNWYQLTINSVSGPGFPEIDDSEGEHVDDEEGYIKCEIKVLSWAKRSQEVEL